MMRAGKPIPAFCYNYCGAMEWKGAREIISKFAANGCKVFMVPVRGGVENDYWTTPFWTDDGVFPDVTPEEAEHYVGEMVHEVLRAAPDALLWIRFGSSPPKRWREKHPGDLLLNSFGKVYDEASLASDSYNEQLGRFIENTVRFCERQPWGERVIGYLVYPLGEGTTQLTCDGYLFDRSPAMQAGFRAFLRRNGRPEADVPDDRDFHERGKTRYGEVSTDGKKLERIPRRLHWPEPQETAVERDYCLYMRELTGRNFRTILSAVKRAAPNKLAGIDAFKQTLLGWPLVARWVGDYQTHGGAMHPVSGAFAMAELLDLPELDVVVTPHDYLHRGMGFGYEGEGIGDSVVAHGKLFFVEEDQRTFSLSEEGRWNYLKDMKEAKAGLWRNLGSSLSRGYNTYPMDVCGPSFFMDDGIQDVLVARRVVHEAAVNWPRREVPCIVMVVDDSSVIHEDFTIGYQYLAVIHQRLYGLSRCGVPFRLHLFEDLARDDFPSCHKVFLFPNLFHVTHDRLKLLREKVFRKGNVCIFGPASGITDGRRLSAESAIELTGIPLELVRKESPRFVTIDRFDHPITEGFASRLDYGDSLPYGPLLVPREDPEVRRLGGIQWPTARDGAGLVIREMGGWTSVFTCAVPLPAPLLRELARYSGTHIYSESDDDLVFADSCTLAVHSVRPGRRAIKLPKPSTVWDLIARRKLGEGLGEIRIAVNPPQTRLYHLGRSNPFGSGRGATKD
ncbi:MAG TPA: hypothetical protein PLE19_04635 [Planctomycetota bacterium]|nr:hypothetical protein [Planctomycetota bacterium]HRR79074.1 hypothetical protein [Planctomycetota bacterium]